MEQGPALKLKVRDNCSGCGRCVAVCPQHALSLETERPEGQGAKYARVDSSCCTACGACLLSCPRQSLFLDGRDGPAKT